MRIRYLLITALLLLPVSTWSAPSISSVAGTFSHDNSVSISGTLFGSKSPAAPLLWDDGEDATLNSEQAMGLIYSHWYPSGADTVRRPKYRSTTFRSMNSPHPYSSVIIVCGHTDDGVCDSDASEGYNCNFTFSFEDQRTEDMFAMWRTRVDPLWPAENEHSGATTPKSPPNSKNHKWFILEEDGSEYEAGAHCYLNDDNSYTPYAQETFETILPQNQSGFESVCDWEGNPANDNSDYRVPSEYTGYIHREVWMWDIATPGAGYLQTRVDNQIGWEPCVEGEGVPVADPGCAWAESIFGISDIGGATIGGFSRNWACPGDNEWAIGDDNAFRAFDDIYIDNTMSRVMIANAASYSQATTTEPQIPSAWSGTSITVTVNLGAIAGSTAWLYVFDADNVMSAAYTVTIDAAEQGGEAATTYNVGIFSGCGIVK